jgi:GH24 family phage-related lysozyme (muramidase)
VVEKAHGARSQIHAMRRGTMNRLATAHPQIIMFALKSKGPPLLGLARRRVAELQMFLG